jgi:hypothetical protein
MMFFCKLDWLPYGKKIMCPGSDDQSMPYCCCSLRSLLVVIPDLGASGFASGPKYRSSTNGSVFECFRTVNPYYRFMSNKDFVFG